MVDDVDLDETLRTLQELIAERGLLQVSASFSHSDVLIEERTVPVTLVQLLAAMGPTFVSLRADWFDATAFAATRAEALGEDGRGISEEGHRLIRAARDRQGQLRDLTLQWVSDGLVYTYFLEAAWLTQLVDGVEQSALELDDDRPDPSVQLARTHELTTALEGLPDFRGLPPSKRRAKGDQLLETLLTHEDRENPYLHHVVGNAVALAATNAEDAYAEVDLAAVAALPQWRATGTQQGRTDLALMLLPERTGYGCDRSRADVFRRQVDAAAAR